MADEGRTGDDSVAVVYSVAVPGSWLEVDVHPVAMEQSIRGLVEDRAHGRPGADRLAVERLLRREGRLAWESGAAYCACFSVPTCEGPLTGALTITVMRGPFAETGPRLGRLFVASPQREDLGPYSSLTPVWIESVGRCLRAAGIEDVSSAGGVLRRVFMHTALPVPDADVVFLVSARSPVVPLVAELHEIFEAVSGTFRVHRLDE